MAAQPLGKIYDQINGEDATRLCKDIPEAACKHLPRNYFAYLASNVISKLADELSSARLVLPWLFSALGAPVALVGFIVPLREAGVLLPQLFVAEYLRKKKVRKYAWMAGASFSGLCLLLAGGLTPLMPSAAAGYLLLFLLLAYSLGRGVCSVTAKDIIGKTVSKKRRGSLMGYSAGISSALTLALGIWLTVSKDRASDNIPFLLVLFAGALWFLSAACFSRIVEEPGATEGGRSPITAIRENLKLLTNDRTFRHYLLARTLLLSAALSPPFYTLLAKEANDSANTLGWLILAGGIAGTIGGPIWGKFSDYSSRLTMSLASLASGIFGIAVALIYAYGSTEWIQTPLAQAFVFFMVSVFYAGVRLGRKTYLVDMVSGDKSAYVAVGNTLIGLALLIMGSFGLFAESFGPSGAIGILGIVSIIASLVAWRLQEVSR